MLIMPIFFDNSDNMKKAKRFSNFLLKIGHLIIDVPLNLLKLGPFKVKVGFNVEQT